MSLGNTVCLKLFKEGGIVTSRGEAVKI